MKSLGLAIFLVSATPNCAPQSGSSSSGATSSAVFSEGVRSTGWLPLSVHRTGHVFVATKVGGTEVEGMLDTAAAMTTIDTGFAKAHGIDLGDAVSASGVGGTASAHLARGVTIEVGALKFRPPTVAVVDLAAVAKDLGRDLSLVIGRELFDAAVVEIDYAGARVAFDDPGRERTPLSHVLPLFPADQGTPAIEVSVEGRPHVRVQVDIGSNDTLKLFRSYVESANLLAGRSKVSTRLSGGVGGMAPVKEATLEKIVIGGLEVRGVPALFVEGGPADRGTSTRGSSKVDGRIGSGILQRFRVVVDVPHGRLELEPTAETARPFPKNRLGLQSVLQSNALEVVHVAAGSPAEAAGWHAGDRVTEFGGRSVDGACWSAWIDCIGQPAGTVVVLRDGEGKERKVTLAEYD